MNKFMSILGFILLIGLIIVVFGCSNKEPKYDVDAFDFLNSMVSDFSRNESCFDNSLI
jgi:hypothetical protein